MARVNPIIDNTYFVIDNRSERGQSNAELDLALAYLQGSHDMSGLMHAALAMGPLKVNVNYDMVTNYNATTRTINWDPRGALVVGGGTGTQSPALVLGHEISHAADEYLHTHGTYPQSESNATNNNNSVALQLGEPTRATYEDVQKWQKVSNPTMSGQNGMWVATDQGNNYHFREGWSSTPDVIEPIGPPVTKDFDHLFTCFGYWTTQKTYDEWGFENVIPDANAPKIWVEDPVILNFLGKDVQTVSYNESGVFFDLRDDGAAMQSGWLAEGEGFLVFDQKANGAINSANDLISHLSQLTKLDSNHDGKLNAMDNDWKKLEVWADTHQGKFTQSDMHTLEELGIIEISLNIEKNDGSTGGNQILDTANIVFSNGEIGQIASVALIGKPEFSELYA